jgi:hypothetical protein
MSQSNTRTLCRGRSGVEYLKYRLSALDVGVSWTVEPITTFFAGSIESSGTLRRRCAGMKTVNATGKASGVLAPDPAIAAECFDVDATFVAMDTDTGLSSRAAADLTARVKRREATALASDRAH